MKLIKISLIFNMHSERRRKSHDKLNEFLLVSFSLNDILWPPFLSFFIWNLLRQTRNKMNNFMGKFSGQIQNNGENNLFSVRELFINKLCVVMAFPQNIYVVLRSIRQKESIERLRVCLSRKSFLFLGSFIIIYRTVIIGSVWVWVCVIFIIRLKFRKQSPLFQSFLLLFVVGQQVTFCNHPRLIERNVAKMNSIQRRSCA